MLENDEDFMSADIYIDPLIDSDNSDQDTVAEDGGRIVDDLPGNVLQAEAHDVSNAAVSSIMSLNRFVRYFAICTLQTICLCLLVTNWRTSGHCVT